MEDCTNLFHALVTHIVDPNNIWIRCGTDYDIQQYAVYQHDLDAFYNKNGYLLACNGDSLYRGAFVVVADSIEIEMNDTDTTCHWRRAYVKQYLNEKMDTVDVFFIDLGYSEIVKRNQLRVFPQEFQTLHSQAVPVSLACIKPLAQSWTTRAKSFLEAKVLHKDILLSFVSHDEISGHDAVAMYIKIPDGSWYSLIHEMEMEELALLTGQIPEVLTEEAANIGLELMNRQQREQLIMQSMTDEESQLSYEGREQMEETATVQETGSLHDSPSIRSEVNYLEDQVPSHMPSSSDHSQDASIIGQCEVSSPEEISQVDFGSLAERTSFSITKLQEARQDELKRKTRAHIMASMDSDAADLASISEDQDWDKVRDIDTHDDIQSQIHKVVQRQISDGEVAQFARELEQLSRGIIQSPVSHHVPNQKSGGLEQKAVEERDFMKSESETEKKSSQTPDATHISQQDKEIEEYKIVKKIQEILTDPDNMGADVVSAFIHSIVEPDVDTSCDDLSTVLYALLDHAICKSDMEQEMALGVLETYSDTNCFVQAMLDVLLKLKDEYVKQTKSVRLKGKHMEFAKMLALIFTYANDWDPRSTRDIQEFISCFIHNWIVFNKSRHQTGEAVFDTELMYLECAEVFLPRCFDILKEKFQETVSDLMSEVRHKLLHDSTPRWIREHLLDLMLNLTCNGGIIKETKRTENSATQTAFVRDSYSRDSDIKYSRPCDASITSLNDTSEASVLNGKQKDDGTSHASSFEQLDSTVASHSSVKQFISSKSPDLNVEQPVMEKETGIKRPLDRYSCQTSDYTRISQKGSDHLIDQPSSKSSSSSFVPAECLSSLSQAKKRGVPKSIRNLPPRLLRICQEGLPTHSSPNQQDIYVREQQNNSSVHSLSVSSADLSSCDQQSILEEKSESMGQESPLRPQRLEETSLEISRNSDAAPEISLVEPCHGSGKESPSEEESNVSQHSQLILSEEPRTDLSSEVPFSDIESSTALNSTANDVSDMVQMESDHQGEESDHQGEESDHQGEESDHQGEESDHQGEESDHQGEENDCQAGEEEEREERTVDTEESLLKYSTLQLREMNPDKYNSPLPLEELWEPHEILEKMIAQTRRWDRIKPDFNNDSNKVSREISMINHEQNQSEGKCKARQSPSMAGDDIGSGSCYLPADYADALKSQSPTFGTENISDLEAHNAQDNYEYSPAPNKSINTSSGRNKSGTRGGLKNIAEDLLFTAITDINTESKSDPNADTGIEIWHENNNAKNSELKENISEGHSGKGKGKKKKLKYRPLEFFESTTPILNDGKGDADIDVENLDEFSPAALRMYEDLEKEEKEKEAFIAAGCEILTFSKFGGSAISDPKRPSLFAEVRQRHQAPKVSKPWCPGKRKCTRCGSEEHTVYDCEDDGSSLYKC